jgi:hypothetical protein
MTLDRKLALNDVSFNKSDFHHIPVAARSAVGSRLSREKRIGERASREEGKVKKRAAGKAKTGIPKKSPKSWKSGNYRTHNTFPLTISAPESIPGPRTL